MKTSEFWIDSSDTVPFFYIHSLTLRKLKLHMPTKLLFSKGENNHVGDQGRQQKSKHTTNFLNFCFRIIILKAFLEFNIFFFLLKAIFSFLEC